MPTPQREDRLYCDVTRTGDVRAPGHRDHDRVIYCSAFLRLAGVTQVAHAADGCVVHNRLTHSLKVARIGRALAKRLGTNPADLLQAVGGVDPETVEAAALAHDLGHPPFGHVAERALQDLVFQTSSDFNAFEGNAQSFRVVTKLAVRRMGDPQPPSTSPPREGLNLTRATLNAILKYPWLRGPSGKEEAKWGAYSTESKELDWARQLSPNNKKRSAEAEVVNWADDIAYATHDVEDFYRAGLLPLDRLITDDSEIERFLNGTFARWKQEKKEMDYPDADYAQAFHEIIATVRTCFPSELNDPYNGSRRQRAAINSFVSTLITRFFEGLTLKTPSATDPRRVKLDVQFEKESTILQALIWHYVIRNPSLAAQEYGQRQVIESLFTIYHTEALADPPRLQIFPIRYREQIDEARADLSGAERDKEIIRIIVDVIAEMTEYHAYEAYKRLNGHSPATILDFIQR